MNTVSLYRIIFLTALIACALVVTALAFAEEGVSASASASTSIKAGDRLRLEAQSEQKAQIKARDVRVAEAKARAKAELDRRITALTKLIARLNDAKRVSADVKAQITTDTNALIASLTTLGAQIQSETSTSSLRSQVQSITGSYRVYLLVIPKGHLLSAADGIKSTADLITNAGIKLSDGINKAKAKGENTSSLEAMHADLLAKAADAKVQADAAIALLTPLKPDEKNNVVFEANKKALTDARAKIKAGTEDLKAARDDAHKILVALKQMRIYAGASASSTTATQ